MAFFITGCISLMGRCLALHYEFSTSTVDEIGVYTQNPDCECNGDVTSTESCLLRRLEIRELWGGRRLFRLTSGNSSSIIFSDYLFQGVIEPSRIFPDPACSMPEYH
jgi:hypothetical protein